MRSTTYDEYFKVSLQYRERYGDRTVVLMQIGDFMEMYALPEMEAGWNSHEMLCEICENLQIVLTSKNKNKPISKSNPYMAGFNMRNMERFFKILVRDYGYTAIEIEQLETLADNGLRERQVKRVMSPGTYDEDTLFSYEENNLMVLYIDSSETKVAIGCSTLDLTTGNCEFEEDAMAIEEMDAYVCNRVIRFQPREILVIYEGDVRWREVHANVHVVDHTSRFVKEHRSPNYQNELLRKVYTNTGMLSPLEYIDIEMMTQARFSFCYLIQFVWEQNMSRMFRIDRPLNKSRELLTTLILSNDSAEQLDLLDSHPSRTAKDSKHGLCAMLNTCVTNMGKRHFRKQMLAPMIERESITKAHDRVSRYVELSSNQIGEVRNDLRRVKDLQRLIHKHNITPHDIFMIATSVQAGVEVLRTMYEVIDEDIQKCLELIRAVFDIPKCENISSLRDSLEDVFVTGVHPKADEMKARLIEIRDMFARETDNDWLTLNVSEKEGFSLVFKESHHAKLRSKLYPKFNKAQKTGNKTLLSVTNEELTEANQEYLELRATHASFARKLFVNFVVDLKTTYTEILNQFAEQLATFDTDIANAHNAHTFGLTRPTIVPHADHAMFQATKLRHPIIERFQSDVRYVSNDVYLGEDGSQGIILYGVNASGKSSLMKSVGIAIVMAQAGMFVPAESMEWAPFRSIYTRILNTDNLYKGQSTFVREMSELRTILRYGDAYTLVLGDELCSGTETQSAIALVGAGIDMMIRSRSKFVMATHLHELHTIPEIANESRIRVAHLSVTFDETTGSILYDRTLREGAGHAMYGLEVCKSLDLPAHFISTANRIRRRLDGEHVDPRASRYNSKVYMNGVCQVCKGTLSQEIHHIHEQRHANENHRIEEFHKNSGFNLVRLCRSCHNKVHSHDLNIVSYRNTTNGVELEYQWASEHGLKN